LIGLFIAGIIYFSSRSKKIAVYTILISAILLVLAYSFIPNYDNRINTIFEAKGASENSRIELWNTAIDMGIENPILGVGPGNWTENARRLTDSERVYGHPHNDILNIWATSGGLGLITFLVFYISIFMRWWKESKIFDINTESYDLYLGGILALFGLSIASQFQCFMIDGENLIALSVVMGLAISARNQIKNEMIE
jgi:O-antigen ligase